MNASTSTTAATPPSTSVIAPLLRVHDLHLSYGGIQALKGVSLDVAEGELVALIGSNGAGKSSTMKAITGTHPLASGRVEYQGQDLANLGTWERVAQGLVLIPEGRGVFARMTITENLQMGAYLRESAGGQKAQLAADLERVFAALPRLKERRDQLAGTLSGGEQQMLAMGRALMSRPKLLLLDEPSMGLAPIMVDKIYEVVQQVAAQGVSILLVEQNAQRALQLATRAYVMESGLIGMSGDAKTLLHDPAVRAAYLGE
jgi:branched-chain amino acid transport system ATP-binding protein